MENWSPSVFNGPGPTHNRSSVHTALTGGNGIGAAYNFPGGQQADAGFYAYGVIWSANMIQFYVNPTTTPQSPVRPFFIVTASDLPAGDPWPFNAAAFLLANVAVGGTLGGSTDNTPSPEAMTIDYIRQYTPSAVPAPALGSPPPLTVRAGATVDNTSTFAPSLGAGTHSDRLRFHRS
jgi:beta-glucanase (GH16 family)